MKTMFLLLITTLFISCVPSETEPETYYLIKFIPNKNLINYDGQWVENRNMLTDQGLNRINFRPHITEGYIDFFIDEKVVNQVSFTICRFEKINDNYFRLTYDKEWLGMNKNEQLGITIRTIK